MVSVKTSLCVCLMIQFVFSDFSCPSLRIGQCLRRCDKKNKDVIDFFCTKSLYSQLFVRVTREILRNSVLVTCSNPELNESIFNLMPTLNQIFPIQNELKFIIDKCPFPSSFSVFTRKLPAVEILEFGEFLEMRNANDSFFEIGSPIAEVEVMPDAMPYLRNRIFENLQHLVRIDFNIRVIHRTYRLLKNFFKVHVNLKHCRLSLTGFSFSFEPDFFNFSFHLESVDVRVKFEQFWIFSGVLSNKPFLKTVRFSGDSVTTDQKFYSIGHDLFANSSNLEYISFHNFYMDKLSS